MPVLVVVEVIVVGFGGDLIVVVVSGAADVAVIVAVGLMIHTGVRDVLKAEE